MEKKILQIINTVLRNRSKGEIEALNLEMSLRNDIGFDSLDLAELTVRIEAEYGIDVFDNGIVSTVGEIVARLS